MALPKRGARNRATNIVGGAGLRTATAPIPVQRSVRSLDHRVVTSLPAGKMVPIMAFPLLREDSLRMSRYRFSIELMETAEILANAVIISVHAWLVPFLALNRFDGMDALNRSYQKQPSYEPAGPVIPFFTSTTTTIGPGATENQIYYYLGEHVPTGSSYNKAYLEAYNEIWNMRAKNRSPDIPLINSETNVLLQPAFWPHHPLREVVPDFDQATIDGEVPLNVTSSMLPIRGMGVSGTQGAAATQTNVKETGGVTVTYTSGHQLISGQETAAAGQAKIAIRNAAGFPDIYAELAENGITVSLANIEVARKTQAFAALRKMYEGVDDDYIIDLLMQGISVPEQDLRQPMLLGSREATFGMAKRYSSDSTDLTASVVNGAALVDLSMTCPRISTGGIVMVCAEIVPEQLYERQMGPLAGALDQDLLPNYLRDTLDPEKVEIVYNRQIDTNHATPAGVFGYAPLNWTWNRAPPRIGGKFYRPAVDDPLSEERMRFWAAETANPTLSRDFYLVSSIDTDVFVVTDEDIGEVVVRGTSSIEGNTVFGRMLVEADDTYDEIMAEAPLDRIDQPGGAVVEAEAQAEEEK